ncbi:uncharacterized protein LOC134280509 [Saccostrea cucullata]|uniref:uncharacterized protein LOC134280509 n=1 Tax=Saccostrea cuccullata TaxID=36930 RepID=UPI002ED51246
MLQGNMDNLPNLPRSVVRIFISSTFSDMRAERNILSHEVFPKLKQLCLAKDLDFQVVDMRWGVTEDSQNDHSVEKICLQEIENCQKLSLGPNFVAIIGDRYGFRPIPTEIFQDDFKIILSYVTKDIDLKLLDTWYKLDENCKPQQYILQPISSQFSFFADFSPGCDEHRARHTKEWNATLTSLQSVLRDAALQAFHSKKFTEAQMHEYFYSVTEIEIRKGILSSEDPASQTAVFCREITGFKDFEDTLTMRFIDTVKENGKNNVNSEIRNLQNELKQKLETKTKHRNSHTYKVSWSVKGIDPGVCKEHEEYLKTFCKDFYNDFSQMIDNALDKRKSQIRRRQFRSQFPEILHHLHFCKTKCKTFCGQETILNTVKHYILNTSMNKPFVLHAPSGSGKTSVMAMIVNNLRTWLKDDNFVGIIRFLGTSGLCLNVYDVLVSLVKQLSDVSGIRMEPIGFKKMKNLLEYFPRFIRRVANTLKKPVIILLDSIDQLSGEYDAHSMKWLPMILPQNIKVIISTLPNEFGILHSMRALSQDSSYYLEISDMPLQSGKEMMEKYLSLQNRSLLQTQEKVLMDAFSKCPSPLFLKLSVDEAKKWKSYTDEHHLILQETVQGAINKLFDNLEVKFGHIVSGHALGYITIARDGISENELEDVLSCDDEALNDVYRYHNPPVEGIVRIPPVLVARIKYDIREYIVERLSQDKYTMNWYHRQFTECAKARYSTGTQGEVLHKNLTEIFMCETSLKRDITLTRRKLTISNADRQVTEQPVSDQNKRMLFCLPYHIIQSGRSMSLQTAKDKCFCNFNFIHNKLEAFSADVLVSELNEFLQLQEDPELEKLRDFFISSPNDVFSPKRLAISLLEYVSVDTADTSLQKLLSKAEDFLRNQSTSTLIPLHPGKAPRKGLAEAIICSFTEIDGIISYSQGAILVKDSSNQNEDVANSSYKVFFDNAEELVDVGVPFITREEHQPIVDRDGQNVIFISPDSVTCLNLVEKCKIKRQFQNLFARGSKQDICKRISTSKNYLVMLFENEIIIKLNIINLEEINRWTLIDRTADVLDIICTDTEHILVLVARNADNGSELLVYTKETKHPKHYYFDCQMSKNCWGISKAECLFTVLGNKGETHTITSVDFNKGETRTPIEIQDRLKYISYSESTSIVCCWSDEHNVVVAFDLEIRKLLYRVKVSNLVSCATLGGESSLLFVGEEDGTVSLFDSVTGNPFTSVKAHGGRVQQVVVLDELLISHGKGKMLVWSLKYLLESLQKGHEKKCVSSAKRLLDETSIISIALYSQDDQFITVDENGGLKIWTINEGKFVKEFSTNLKPKKVLCLKEMCCVLSKNKELRLFNLQTSERVDIDLPKDVLDVVMGTNSTVLYTLGMNGKYLVVSILDLRQKTTRKSFPLQSIIQFESLDICLSRSERYLCIRLKVTQEELENIKASSEKRSFTPQDHPNKFVAVDLQQETGGLMPCVRNFSPIPHLGEVICSHIGNSMIINKRDWVIFWDIPAGKCRRRAKEKEQSANRNNWFENFKDFKGHSKALAQTKDGQTMALGMKSGYVLLFNTTTAYPIGEKLPITKHAAPVTSLVFSADGHWLASACQNNRIKVWNCMTATEIFSTKAHGEVQEMIFSIDSRHLIALSGKQFSRILLYRIHPGDNERVDK